MLNVPWKLRNIEVNYFLNCSNVGIKCARKLIVNISNFNPNPTSAKSRYVLYIKYTNSRILFGFDDVNVIKKYGSN